MLPASNKGVGMNIGFPDVCLTPMGPAVVPVPYPNFALNAMATPFAATVKISMMNALNLGSAIPLTFGDEPGTASPTKGVGRYTMGNPVVYVEGLPAINLLCPTTGNNANDGLGAVVVPSVTNVFFTDAAPLRGGVALDGLRALAAALEPGRAPDEGMLLAGGVALLAIRRFSAGVPARVFTAVRRLSARGMTALVLDLRDNPGGELIAAVELAGDFLEPGAVIATTVDADGDAIVHRARQERPYRFPVAVLVDRRTASAAEVFAGCLKAHGRAVIAGEATYGKGTGHQLLAETGGGAAYAAVARCLLPDGRPIDGVGVQPDLRLEPPLEASPDLPTEV